MAHKTSFYQSGLRRYIQESIYKKPVFELYWGGETYRGVIKQQRLLGQEVRWSMLHGVSFTSLAQIDMQMKQDLAMYKRDHSSGRDLFVQVGCDMVVDAYPTGSATTHLDSVLKKISYIERDFLTRYHLRPTCREHMPHATIMLSTQGSMDERKRACTDSGKRMINKGQKAELDFSIATTEQERRQFRRVWYTTSYDKGFHIIPEEQFITLMRYLTDQKQGSLFVAKRGDAVVSGSVCVAHEKTWIYLYGATDRAFGSIGAHYWLTMHIRAWARDHGYVRFDLFGIALPHSGAHHPLAGVTRFKQSFGGETIVYAGSYDYVCSPRGYRAFKARRAIKR